ncbi:prepilin peptidase [Aliivibrio sp. S4TY2]|nr:MULTISPECIES: prepilin peptidase [unclassified Aliivibrio]MDD9158205.1 prepilin peptidase [Aliivibrio sp. S4TY2]MDD9187199.1 prepilin peptidase [Aliivibrio sp. S4MY3]
MSNLLFKWWLLLATISCFICYKDISVRVISNRMCMMVLALCCVICILINNYNAVQYSILIFIIGFILFLMNIIAAGDIKLASAFAVAVNPKYQLLVITIILLLGGVIAFSQLLWGKYRSNENLNGVPYGVPICVGYLFGIAASI